MGRPVQIVDYDPAWPELFERERALIAEALGDLAAAIEHVGSTAVPGLGAKPILDMMVGLRSLEDGERSVAPLEALGYEYMGEMGIPGRFYFRKPPGHDRLRTHHIHMVELACDFWQRHLLFRDYLRSHPEDARRYHELKARLAARYGADREGYTEAKTEFIRSCEERARELLGQAKA